MRTVSWIGVVCLLAGTCAAALAQAPVGTWATAAPLPQPRAEHAVVGLDGKIYAIAGGIPTVDGTRMQQNGASTLVEEYDPATDRWRVRAPLPVARDHLAAVVVDGKNPRHRGADGELHRGDRASPRVRSRLGRVEPGHAVADRAQRHGRHAVPQHDRRVRG